MIVRSSLNAELYISSMIALSRLCYWTNSGNITKCINIFNCQILGNFFDNLGVFTPCIGLFRLSMISKDINKMFYSVDAFLARDDGDNPKLCEDL